MHAALAEVNVPADRMTNNDRRHCFHATEQDLDSANNADDESNDTLREVNIESSQWISERLYQQSNNESSDNKDKNSDDVDLQKYRGDLNDSNSFIRSDPESCEEITSEEISLDEYERQNN